MRPRLLLLVLILWAGIQCCAQAGSILSVPSDNEASATQAAMLYKAAQDSDQTEDKMRLFRQSIDVYPELAAAYNNLAMLIFQSGDREQALQLLRRGLQAAEATNDVENVVNIHNNLGFIARSHGRMSVADTLQAISHFDAAIKTNPEFVGAIYNKASALLALRHDHEAQELLLKVLEKNPNDVSAHLDLGRIYFEHGDLEQALKHEDAVIASAWSMGERLQGMHNKGTFLKEYGFLIDAVQVYDEMLAIRPHEAHILVNAMTVKRLLCDWREMENLEDRILIAVEPELEEGATRENVSYLPYDSTLVKLSDGYRKRLAIATSSVYQQSSTLELLPSPWTEQGPSWDRPSTPQRLKIGYLSFDFRDHPMGHLTLGIIEQHAAIADAVDTFCYSYGPSSSAASTYWRKQFLDKCSVFRDLLGLSDLEAAQKIGLDGVDVLVDLMAHTKGARLGIPALRPSRIAVNYLGFPGTMGSSFIDYVMVDRMVLPPQVAAASMTEQVVYLPHTYQANRYDVSIEACGADTAGVECQRANLTKEGLPLDSLVFCNFNTINKMESESFSVWMSILRQVPGSVLWLLAPSGGDADHVMDALREQAKAHGVLPTRLVFAPRVDKLSHLARVSLADLFLDSFTYNAHSTAADALWANVPIVTFWGDTFPSRVAASLILNAVPFPELVPHSVKDYERIAVYLATAPNVLRRLRQQLAAHNLVSPLFDTRGTTESIEAAYEVMHDLTNRLHPSTQEDKKPRVQLIIHPTRTAGAFTDVEKRNDRLSKAVQRGISLQKAGDVLSAQHVYTRVLRADPGHADVSHLLGSVFYQFGQLDRAVEYFEDAVSASPDVSWYHSNLGVTYMKLDKLELAESEFKFALQLNSLNGVAISKLASIYNSQNAYDKVVELYTTFGEAAYFGLDSARSVNPSSEQIQDAYVEYLDALVDVGRSKEAEEILRKAVQRHPSLYRLRYNLSVLYNLQKKYEEGNEIQISTALAEALDQYERKGRNFVKVPRPDHKVVIAIYCNEYGHAWWTPWGPSSLKSGLGGSEEAVVFLSRELQNLGYLVEVYGDPPPEDMSNEADEQDAVRYYPHYTYDVDDSGVDIFVAWRYHISLAIGKTARKKYLWMHDVPAAEVKVSPLLNDVDGIFCLSEYQASQFPENLQSKVIVSSNGLSPEYFADGPNHADRFVYGSNPTRGLFGLLKTWPRIRESIPSAELSIFYGFRPMFLEWGPQHMSNFTEWKTELDRLLRETPGVRNVGLVDHARLAKEYSYAGFYLYPTTFSETSCISLMKAMANGAIPITSRNPNSAIPETVGDFDLGPRALRDSLATDPEWYDLWVQSILDAVRDEQQALTVRHRMKRFARKKYRWEHIALQWHRVISKPRFPQQNFNMD